MLKALCSMRTYFSVPQLAIEFSFFLSSYICVYISVYCAYFLQAYFAVMK